MYYPLEEVRKDLHSIYDEGEGRGLSLSLPIWREPFSIVPGTFLVVYGPPHSGKSQLIFEILIDVCMKYNLQALIASPEEGEPHEIYKTLVEMVAQKDYTNAFGNQMTVKERLEAEMWVQQHFMVTSTDKADGDVYEFREWYENVNRIERETGMEFNITVLDPFDEIKIDWSKERRSDLVLQKELIWLRKYSAATKRYNIIGAHVRDQQKVSQKIDGVMRHYYPPADPQDISHGQEWYRRGMAMLGVWRPPSFLTDENGKPYEKNSTVVTFGKQKPKKVKDTRSTIKRIEIFWDPKRHRYYQEYFRSPMYPPRLNEEAVSTPTGIEAIKSQVAAAKSAEERAEIEDANFAEMLAYTSYEKRGLQ